jgi:hypothetical protein
MSREKFGKNRKFSRKFVFFGTFGYGQLENLFFSQKTYREGGILAEKMR